MPVDSRVERGRAVRVVRRAGILVLVLEPVAARAFARASRFGGPLRVAHRPGEGGVGGDPGDIDGGGGDHGGGGGDVGGDAGGVGRRGAAEGSAGRIVAVAGGGVEGVSSCT